MSYWDQPTTTTDYATVYPALGKFYNKTTKGFMGLFSRGDAPPGVDISGELAKIRALYAAQADALKADSKQQLQEANKTTASNLAGRGILSSPVSEYSFGANQKAAGSDLTHALAGLYGGQASTESNLLGLLSGQANQANMMRYQQGNQNKNNMLALLLAGGLAAFGGGGAAAAGGLGGKMGLAALLGGGYPQYLINQDWGYQR